MTVHTHDQAGLVYGRAGIGRNLGPGLLGDHRGPLVLEETTARLRDPDLQAADVEVAERRFGGVGTPRHANRDNQRDQV